MLADFGRAAWADAHNGNAVIYPLGSRAPELLFAAGSRMQRGKFIHARVASYGLPADVWALGCLIGWLALGEPVFGCTTQDELQNAVAMMQYLGVPDLIMAAQLRWSFFNEGNTQQWAHLLRKRSPSRDFRDASVDRRVGGVVSGCLQYNPERRLVVDAVIVQLGGPCCKCRAQG